MKKKLLGLILLLTLLMSLLPVSVWAAAPSVDVSFRWGTAGQQTVHLAEGQTYYAITDTKGNLLWLDATDSWNVKLTYPADGTPQLTLRDATISNNHFADTTGNSRVIAVQASDVAFQIRLEGENSIVSKQGMCLFAANLGGVTITGPGSLTCNGQGDNTMASTIWMESTLTVKDTTLNISQTSYEWIANCITSVEGDVIFDGATVNMLANYGAGIYLGEKSRGEDARMYVDTTGGRKVVIKNGTVLHIDNTKSQKAAICLGSGNLLTMDVNDKTRVEIYAYTAFDRTPALSGDYIACAADVEVAMLTDANKKTPYTKTPNTAVAAGEVSYFSLRHKDAAPFVTGNSDKPDAIVQLLSSGTYTDWFPNRTELRLSQGGKTKYLICRQSGENWYATTQGANVGNYNIKIEYEAGGIPVITFRNATIKNELGFAVGMLEQPLKNDHPAILYDVPFKIVLEGKNTITATHSRCGFSLYTVGEVTITGPGTLDLTVNRGGAYTGAIQAMGDLIFDNAKINIKMDPGYYRSNAIANVGGDILIDGGKIFIDGVMPDAAWETVDAAFYVKSRNEKGGNLIVQGGAVVSAAVTPYNTDGLEVDGDFVISESTFELGIAVSKRDGVDIMNKLPTLQFADNKYTTYTTRTKSVKLESGVIVPAEDKYIDVNTLENLSTVTYFKVAPGGDGSAYGVIPGQTPEEDDPEDLDPVIPDPSNPSGGEEDASPDANAPTDAQPAPSDTPEPTEKQETPTENPQKSGTGLLILLIVLCVLLAGGGGFAVYWFAIRPYFKKA